MTVQDLPALNATLNGLAAVWLLLGFRAIRQKRESVHKRYMLLAVATSTLFLASYLTYHLAKEGGLTRFPEAYPVARMVYRVVLFTHSVLATFTVPMVGITLWHALRGNLPRHRRLARWTLPIWFYVSVTGVLIYFTLYHWFPAP